MAITCVCNVFNHKQVAEGVSQYAKDFPSQPTYDDVYRLYEQVYSWCGLTFQQRDDARPRCERCFEAFIDQAIEGFLSKQVGETLARGIKHEAIKAHADKKTGRRPVAA